MLDAITDFWKPAKKAQAQEKLTPELLQVGSAIGFGFVPQAILSGRRLEVSAINTYQFGEETLTSFVLVQEENASENAPVISMIIAEAEGEHYLAISRRISIGERTRLFTTQDVQNITTKSDVTKLPCKDNIPDFKGWVVSSYRREIHGLKGRIFKGDFRKKALPPASEAQEFEYTLLVSDSNEHAIEIEQYNDGRMEMYTTIYRRMSDIGEITHPANDTLRPDIKLASDAPVPAAAEPASALSQPKFSGAPRSEAPAASPVKPQESAPQVTPPAAAPPLKPAAQPPVSNNPIKQEEKIPMASIDSPINGAPSNLKTTAEASIGSKLYVQAKNEPYTKQEIKAVTNGAMNNFDADAIECDLRVANKIIDEAIRNEMRLTDIVRRIIELPVAYPESVQIPITLTDEDYALLAIRYGIPSSDRNAIKRRIIEDLNDFSGGAKKAA